MKKRVLVCSAILAALGCASAYGQATSRVDTIQYSDNLSTWVLGQVSETTTNGVVVSQTIYDPTTSLPTATYSFGLLKSATTYNADGTIATTTDGNGNATVFKNYMRGIPQEVDFPATPDQTSGTSITAVVDSLGQINSIVDQNGSKTCYGYDAMGRISSIQLPSDDPSATGQCDGTTTSINFSPITSAQYGLPAGSWQQSMITGNAVTQTFYDGLWRPVVAQTYDQSNTNASISQVITRYDVDGNVAFKSYPQRTVDASVTNTWGDPTQTPNATGTHAVYDALDRMVSKTQDAEAGVQVKTTTNYLAGFQTQVIDPNNNVTTTSYLTYDEPTTDWPISISAPDGVTQAITRDAFGSPTSITQSGSYNGQAMSVTKYLAYDTYHRLCRFYDPETNSTVYNYDNNNNIAWLATGQSIAGDGTVCGQNQVASSNQTVRTYDAMNRLTSESPPSGTQATIYHYDALGRHVGSITGILIDGISYDRTGHITQERQWIPGDANYNRSISYIYDSYGHRVNIIYPDGAVIGEFPDALGRPTVVQGGSTFFASAIDYLPDGHIASYLMGNGVSFGQTENTRQLPSDRLYFQSSSNLYAESYTYDANANITAIADGVSGSNSQTLGYDGLNRLTYNNAPHAWGTETYTYDPLNNLRATMQGAASVTFNLDTNYRFNTTLIDGALFAAYQYDANGNRNVTTAYGVNVPQTFDAKNQLLSDANTATYFYDEAGLRIKKTLASGANSYFFYNHDGQLLYTYDASSGVGTDYMYLNGQLIARTTTNGTITYLLTDRLGTPVREMGSSGQVTQSFMYRPFGQLFSGVNQSQPGFTGHMNDAETSYTYMQARYYDAGVERSMSPDPVYPTAGDIFSFNRYAYADNNPIVRTDPDGRDPDFAFGVAVGLSPWISDKDKAFLQRVFAQAQHGQTMAEGVGVGQSLKEVADVKDVSKGAMAAFLVKAAVILLKRVGTAGGSRAGKSFTANGRAEIDSANAQRNGGVNVCEECNEVVVPGQKSQRGVTPPSNERQRDHIIPRSAGGDGDPSNGQILCRACNLKKSDST